MKRPTEIVTVKDTKDAAACDGGLGALGHPRVYLPFDGREVVDCYYCSRRFLKASLAERAEEAGVDPGAPLETLEAL